MCIVFTRPDGHALRTNRHINLPPVVTPFLLDKPVGAHTDAQRLGRIAAVFTGATKTAVSTHLQEWFTVMVNELPGESPISICELYAAILTARLALDWPRDKQRNGFLCVDNQADVAALVNGSPSSNLGTTMASLFWNLAAMGSTIWWIEYVHAKSNDFDAPSRRYTSSFESECNRR